MSVNSIVLEVPPRDVLLRTEWEEWGLCPTCGTQTHEIVVRREGTIGDSKSRVPISVPGSVSVGQCLGCEVSKPLFPDLLLLDGGDAGSSCSSRSIPNVVSVAQGDNDDFFKKTRKKDKGKGKKKAGDGDSIGSSIATSIDSNSASRSVDDSSASNGSSGAEESSSDEDSSDDDVSASGDTYVTGNGSTKNRRRSPKTLPRVVDRPNRSGTSPGLDIARPVAQRLHNRPVPFSNKTTELKRAWSKPSRPAWTAKAAIRSHEEELQRMLNSSLLTYTGETVCGSVSVGSSGKSSSLLSGMSSESESSAWVAESKKAARWVPGQSARKIIGYFEELRSGGLPHR